MICLGWFAFFLLSIKLINGAKFIIFFSFVSIRSYNLDASQKKTMYPMKKTIVRFRSLYWGNFFFIREAPTKLHIPLAMTKETKFAMFIPKDTDLGRTVYLGETQKKVWAGGNSGRVYSDLRRGF